MRFHPPWPKAPWKNNWRQLNRRSPILNFALFWELYSLRLFLSCVAEIVSGVYRVPLWRQTRQEEPVESTHSMHEKRDSSGCCGCFGLWEGRTQKWPLEGLSRIVGMISLLHELVWGPTDTKWSRFSIAISELTQFRAFSFVPSVCPVLPTNLY